MELRKAGAPFAEIGRTVGISVYLVKRALVELGVQETPSRAAPYKLNILKERVEELLAQGKTRNQMGSILGISGRSVLTLLARYGLKPAAQEHVNVILAKQGQRRCCECRSIKSLVVDFYNQTGSPRGKGYRCKTCSKNWLRFAQIRAQSRKQNTGVQRMPLLADTSSKA
jgi:hypothetical protein